MTDPTNAAAAREEIEQALILLEGIVAPPEFEDDIGQAERALERAAEYLSLQYLSLQGGKA